MQLGAQVAAQRGELGFYCGDCGLFGVDFGGEVGDVRFQDLLIARVVRKHFPQNFIAVDVDCVLGDLESLALVFDLVLVRGQVCILCGNLCTDFC